VNSEIERALNFSRKCGMLVDTVKKKYKHRFVCLYICLTTSVSQTLLLSSVQFHSIQSNFVHQKIKVLCLYPLFYVRIFAVLNSRLSSTFYNCVHLLQKLNADWLDVLGFRLDVIGFTHRTDSGFVTLAICSSILHFSRVCEKYRKSIKDTFLPKTKCYNTYGSCYNANGSCYNTYGFCSVLMVSVTILMVSVTIIWFLQLGYSEMEEVRALPPSGADSARQQRALPPSSPQYNSYGSSSLRQVSLSRIAL
jgi:hypothetical protein